MTINAPERLFSVTQLVFCVTSSNMYWNTFATTDGPFHAIKTFADFTMFLNMDYPTELEIPLSEFNPFDIILHTDVGPCYCSDCYTSVEKPFYLLQGTTRFMALTSYDLKLLLRLCKIVHENSKDNASYTLGPFLQAEIIGSDVKISHSQSVCQLFVQITALFHFYLFLKNIVPSEYH